MIAPSILCSIVLISYKQFGDVNLNYGRSRLWRGPPAHCDKGAQNPKKSDASEGVNFSPVATEPLVHAPQCARVQIACRRPVLSSYFARLQRPFAGRAPNEDVCGES